MDAASPALFASAPSRLAASIDAIAGSDPGRVAIVVAAGDAGRREVPYARLAGAIAALEAGLAAARPLGVVARARSLESLVAIDPKTEDQLAEPRARVRERAAAIAARWYAESANPAAKSW